LGTGYALASIFEQEVGTDEQGSLT
jgi:hypothetical protein